MTDSRSQGPQPYGCKEMDSANIGLSWEADSSLAEPLGKGLALGDTLIAAWEGPK